MPTPEEINKLDGFGPLYIINLKRRTDRYERMMKLIIDNKIIDYTFIEAVDGKDGIDIFINNEQSEHRSKASPLEIATTISHIKAIEHWLSTSDSEYAIFAEDDLSDETVKYWQWTWKDFLSSITFDYDVLQLCQTQLTKSNHRLHKRMRHDYSAGLYLLKREHAKNIINRMINDGKYKINEKRENILADHYVIFGHSDKVYSCSLFTYNVDTKSDVNPNGESFHKKSRDMVLMFWEKNQESLHDFVNSVKK
jgi:GR25 family glycosyltransferase involved in LPS biosynthesis